MKREKEGEKREKKSEKKREKKNRDSETKSNKSNKRVTLHWNHSPQELLFIRVNQVILTSRTDLFKISKFLLVNGHVIKSRNHGGGMRLHQRVLLLVSGTVVYVLLVGTSASRVFEMEP